MRAQPPSVGQAARSDTTVFIFSDLKKTLAEAAVECFQKPGRAVGSHWDKPGRKQEVEGFPGRRMGVYSEPLEGLKEEFLT
jgi:hypothetical protein